MLCHGASKLPAVASVGHCHDRLASPRPPRASLEKFLVPGALFVASFASAQRQRTRLQAMQANGAEGEFINKNLMVRNVGPKGLGVVATAPLARGELLLEEAPLLVFQNQSFEVIFGDLQDVLTDDRSFDLWEASLTETVESQCGGEAARQFWDLADTCSEPSCKTALGIARTNALGLDADSAGLFLFLSRFNHSCRPNVHHSWQEDRGLQVLRASCSIAANEELCISYLSLLALCSPTRERLGEISDRFGFDCECSACSAGVRRMRDSDWRRERLSQLCAALSQEEDRDEKRLGPSDGMRLQLRKRTPLFFEVDDEGQQELQYTLERGWRSEAMSTSEGDSGDIVESIEMSNGLREATALLDEELHGHPAARALLFFGGFRRAMAAGRLSAAKSLAKAAWNATSTAEGSTSWRAQRLQLLAEDPRALSRSRLEQEEQKAVRASTRHLHTSLLAPSPASPPSASLAQTFEGSRCSTKFEAQDVGEK